MGVIAAITVNRTDNLGVGMTDSSQNRGRYSQVPRVLHKTAVLSIAKQAIEHLPSAVVAAVVHED